MIQIIDFRLIKTIGQGKCQLKLEIALLNYFRSFKKVYLLANPTTASMGVCTVPGGSPAHPLLSLALSYAGNSSLGRLEEKDNSSEINNVSSMYVCLYVCIIVVLMNSEVSFFKCSYDCISWSKSVRI